MKRITLKAFLVMFKKVAKVKKFRLTKKGTIRCQQGRCPIIATFSPSSPNWAAVCVGDNRGLGDGDCNAIIVAADDGPWCSNHSRLKTLRKQMLRIIGAKEVES